MDIEKLIEAVKLCGSTPKVDQCKKCTYWAGGDMSKCIPRMTEDAATALSKLLAENEKLREMYQKEKAVCHATQAELEQVKRERDTLVEDFVDYVTGGVPNPAIFCKNRCSQCVDMRGWCTGKYCSGFYPSGESGPEEG